MLKTETESLVDAIYIYIYIRYILIHVLESF